MNLYIEKVKTLNYHKYKFKFINKTHFNKLN